MKLTPKEHKAIIKMYNDGWTQSYIAKHLKRGVATVGRAIRKHKKENGLLSLVLGESKLA